jgi:hypothetical protein
LRGRILRTSTILIVGAAVGFSLIAIAPILLPTKVHTAESTQRIPIFDTAGKPLSTLLTADMPLSKGELKTFLRTPKNSTCAQSKGAVSGFISWLERQFPTKVFAQACFDDGSCPDCFMHEQTRLCGGDYCGTYLWHYNSGLMSDCGHGYRYNGYSVCTDCFDECKELTCYYHEEPCNCFP